MLQVIRFEAPSVGFICFLAGRNHIFIYMYMYNDSLTDPPPFTDLYILYLRS